MISAIAYSPVTPQRCPGLPQKECPQHDHGPHGDHFVPSAPAPPLFTRNMASQMALASAQMGDSVQETYPSAQFTIGDEPAGQQTQWESNLSSLPKDCYYCTRHGQPTGKCAQDSGEWGSGKNSMGENCSSCGGTGTCRHCGGDGVVG